jgi:apolipoprotein D and lipocalin family protein
VVSPFNPQRYLGTWYEIARFDHHFESGLEKVTATYSLRDDGGLNVVNKGYNPDRGCGRKPTAWLTLPGTHARRAEGRFSAPSMAAIT